jgi:sec-independent protein translocase protein TatA
MRVGWQEIILVLIIALLMFGGKKLPELGKGLGEGLRSFRDALKGAEPQQPPPAQPPATTAQNPQNGDKSVKS